MAADAGAAAYVRGLKVQGRSKGLSRREQFVIKNPRVVEAIASELLSNLSFAMVHGREPMSYGRNVPRLVRDVGDT
jgi:hypothetical protein